MHRDIGRYVDYAANAVPAVTLAAGTSMAATTAQALTSIVIDRLALPRMYRSAVLAVGAELTAPATFTGTVAVKVQDAAGSSGPFTDYSTATQPPTVTLGSTSSTGFFTYESGIQQQNTSAAPQGLTSQILQPIDLSGARRFIQAVVTPTLVSSSSGTIAVGAAFVFGGAEELSSTS